MTFQEAADELMGERIVVHPHQGTPFTGVLSAILPAKPEGSSRERQRALVLRGSTTISYLREDDVKDVTF